MEESKEKIPKIDTSHIFKKSNFLKMNPGNIITPRLETITNSNPPLEINHHIIPLDFAHENFEEKAFESLTNPEQVNYPKLNLTPQMEAVIKAFYDSAAAGQAADFQNKVIKEVVEDPTLPDYSAAYSRLLTERNKPWKLNPSDIADFYLIADFIQRNTSVGTYNEDSRYMAVMKAQERVAAIGQRLLMALSFEQLDEYDRWGGMNPYRIPPELRDKIRSHSTVSNMFKVVDDEEIQPREIDAYLAEFKSQLDEMFVQGPNAKRKVDPEVMDTSLQILETQQTGPWQKMATLMRALNDRSIPMAQVFENLGVENVDEKMIAGIEKNRDVFLIDRLINFVHNTGRMSARVTNYYPRAASLLIAHGLPGHGDYLYFYSSFMTSTDSLAKLIENDLKTHEKRDMVEDLVAAIKAGVVPREYQYALLLEIQDPRIREAIEGKSHENLSPTHIYTLLQRISHHDGVSRGRLKKAA